MVRPVRNYHFQMEGGFTRIFVDEISGIEVFKDILSYQTGDAYNTAENDAGINRYRKIKVRRIVNPQDGDFYNWYRSRGEKRDIIIKILNQDHEPVVAVKCKNCIPVRYRLDPLVSDESKVLMEELDILPEGITFEFD